MKTLSRLLFAAALAVAFGSAQARETYSIYSNDFNDSPDLLGWSSSALSTPPAEDTTKTTHAGGSAINQFLGDFGGTESVSFSLTDERMRNATVTLTLDFLAIRSWDGNDATWGGPDRFTITANLATLLDASFSNGAGMQTYTVDGIRPDPAGSGLFRPMAGSRAQYALGYSFYDGINDAKYNPQDAIYGMIFSFSVGDTDTLDLTFAGLGLQDTWIDNDYGCGEDGSSLCAAYRDESWGLDNVSLLLTAVPAPATLATLCLGLVALAFSRRRRLS